VEQRTKNIYFHVGTGKTGTTFLQYRVFPKLKGIHYIQRTRYPNAVNIIKESDHSSYLVSREFDQQLENEVKAFSNHFPDTVPIIVFRRHDSYIASQYRRFVKNGFAGSFSDFFNLEKDNGRFRKQDLEYVRQIKILEEHFEQKPIVLIYEDMQKDTLGFIKTLAERIGATIELNSVDTTRKHASYSEKQLKAMRWLSSKVDMRKRRMFQNNFINFFWKLGMGGFRYSFLFLAGLLPETMFGNEPLMDPVALSYVRELYASDWEACQKIARSVKI
jgi:hypothetical protein